MIESVHIQNFQSHKDTKLNFHPGVNVITGQSDSGKTAILRALNLAINNRPSGDSFRSSWGGETRVKIDTDDEIAVSRIKSDKKNLYVLDVSDDQDALEFKAMGQGVPEEIERALNMPPLNFQYQMDAPFLLSMSDGEVARFLNEIAKLDVIDRATSSINGKIKKLNANLVSEESRIEQIEEKLKALDYVNELNESVIELERAAKEKEKIALEAGDISFLIDKIDSLFADRANFTWLVKAGSDLAKVFNLDAIVNERRRELTCLSAILQNIESVQAEIKLITKQTRASRLVSRLIKLDETTRACKVEASRINVELEAVARTQSRLSVIEVNIENLHTWWEKHAPEECPLCQKNLK